MRYADHPICQIKQPARPQIRRQSHYSKQQPCKFSALSVLSVDKKWVAGVSIYAKSSLFGYFEFLPMSFFPVV
jgi:hypothetical protein